ncbi:unnamed protein product [Pleuronectes platessa]|uniref:Uncharacterized protein n=1 Tax=Pleuronectes platessa TaxID=8262 RepID=A0A9N7TRF7_PLEPL|nr:unnamed protein product [Pleuronectes platessa]
MDNSDEPEDLLDGKIVFQKNKDRTFSKTKVICTLCEKTLSFHRSNTRLTTATRSMCWSARGVQVECAKPDSLAGHIVQKKRPSYFPPSYEDSQAAQASWEVDVEMGIAPPLYSQDSSQAPDCTWSWEQPPPYSQVEQQGQGGAEELGGETLSPPRWMRDETSTSSRKN